MGSPYINTIPADDFPNISLETNKISTFKTHNEKHPFEAIEKKQYYSRENERLQRAVIAFGYQEAMKMSVERSFCASSARTPNSSMLSYQIMTGDIDYIEPYEYLNTECMKYS